jgi:hypothetical protein
LIRKPQVTLLIKGIFTRFARMHHVRNGSFFDLDPLRQDFVIRDIFRQTLGSDCIQLMEESTDAPPVSVVDEEDEKQDEMPPLISSEIAAAETDVVSDAIALQKPEEEVAKEKQKDDDEVYPDDSISRVMERSPFYAQPSGGENVSAAVSSTSRAQSRVSEFRKPTVRRVHITDVEDEKA